MKELQSDQFCRCISAGCLWSALSGTQHVTWTNL